MQKLSAILERNKELKRAKNISQEFQLFGVYLAESLDDTKHYSLYIKQYERGILEEALSFVKGASSVKSKGRLFMWKLKQMKEAQKTILSK